MNPPHTTFSALCLLIEAHKVKSGAGINQRIYNHIEDIHLFCYEHLFKGGELNSDFSIDIPTSTPQALVFNVQLDLKRGKWSDHTVNVTRDNSESGLHVCIHGGAKHTPGGKEAYYAALVGLFTVQLSQEMPDTWRAPSIELPDWHPLHGVW